MTDSRQQMADLCMSLGQPGRKIVALACRESCRRIYDRINEAARRRAYAKLAEIIAGVDQALKAALLADRAIIGEIRDLYNSCPPVSQLEIVADMASFFNLPLRQVEALLYKPPAESKPGRAAPAMPAPKPLWKGPDTDE